MAAVASAHGCYAVVRDLPRAGARHYDITIMPVNCGCEREHWAWRAWLNAIRLSDNLAVIPDMMTAIPGQTGIIVVDEHSALWYLSVWLCLLSETNVYLIHLAEYCWRTSRRRIVRVAYVYGRHLFRPYL